MTRSTLWYIFLATTFFQMLGSFLYFVVLQDGTAIQAVYFLTKVIMFATPIALLYLGFTLPRLTLKPNLLSSVVMGLGSGVMIAALILSTYFLFCLLYTSDAADEADGW